MLSGPSSWERLSPDEDTAPLGAFEGLARVDRSLRVGRYVVLEEIGRGGMGRVVRAYDPKLQREVALKEVRRETLGPSGARRLVAEARAMAKLSHPNVVAVYDVEEVEDGEVVLVMEYVAGQTLGAWLREPRSWAEILRRFVPAGRGLAAAHAAGLLHRDFKPENVLVGADGRVRVTDFGLARELVPEPTNEPDEPTREAPLANMGLTAPGAIVGTLPYLAPERLTGAPADAASDQFAYCVSLWEALFGERPFAGQSVGELAFAMAAGSPRPPSSAPRVPGWLLAAIVRGLASYPTERWPSMHALLDALAVDPAARRRRWLQAAAGVGALGLAIAGVRTWSFARAKHCNESAAREELVGAWDDTRRATAGPAAQRIDDYASAWAQMHVEACEATAVRGEQSTAVLELRMACLHRAKVELSAVSAVLAHAGARTDDVIAGLPPLGRCADVDALQADVDPPAPEDAAAVEAIREHLARARASSRAGDHDTARVALAEADAALATVSYEPVRTEIALARGLSFERAGDAPRAEQSLREALRLAARSRQATEMLDAATALVVVVGLHQQRFDEALRYADLALGLAEGDPEREARVRAGVAAVRQARGEPRP